MASFLRLRWWQGLIVGAVVGVALWQAQTAFGGWRKPPLAEGISLARFVRLAPLPNDSDTPLNDLVVYPPADAKQLVTALGKPRGSSETHVELAAPFPLVIPPPRNQPDMPAKTYADVRAFLAAAAPDRTYRYAWWALPSAQAGLWIAPPIFLFGVLLPLTIGLLIRLGLIAPPPPESKAAPLPPSPPAPEPPPVDHAAVRSQLDAATTAIEQRLAATPDAPADVAPAAPLAAPQRAFGTPPPDEPLAPAPSAEAKEYENRAYYPVSRPRRDGAS